MIRAYELIDWLSSLDRNAVVGIDDDGLTLALVQAPGITEAQAYLEIGGIGYENDEGEDNPWPEHLGIEEREPDTPATHPLPPTDADIAAYCNGERA